MNTLFLNLASHEAVVACCSETSVIAQTSLTEKVSDHKLITIVEALLKESDWTYKDINRIACVVGPGGFTSLRIAVTFANVLADQLEVETAGVHLSSLFLSRIKDAFGSEAQARRERLKMKDNVYWLHSTKKDQLFIRGGEYDEAKLVDLDEITNSKFQITNWCGELIDQHQEIIQHPSIDLLPYEDVLPKFLNSLTYDTDLLTPWYGRGW